MTGLAKLDGLIAFVRKIGGSYRLIIEPSSQTSIDKAVWLRDAGRDFFSTSMVMQGEILRALRDAFAGSALELMGDRSDAVLQRAAEAARTVIIRRFERGGFDMRLRPLSPEWLAFKRAHGFDPRIGIMTGDLLNDIKAARFRFEKIA